MSTSINIKKQIAAYEEGSQISSDISGIDITGDGASASMVGSKMVVNIPGGMGNITYYLNETVTQAPYKEFSSVPTAAAEQTIVTSIASGATATIQSFQTASGVPGTTNIPGGLWSFYLHFSGTATDTWDVFVEVYKRDLGGIETLLLTTDTISTSTLSGTPTMILTDGVFPTSTVLTTDRIVVKVRVTNTDSTTNSITFHTEGSTNYSVATTTLNQTVPSGAVTSVSGAAPISSSGGTTPTISITQATALVDGYLDSADFATFNAKQDPITLTTTGTTGAATFIANILNIPQYQGSLTLTTTGSSGAATLIANTLNIPTYTLTGLGGVPSTRTITINGTTFDLSADRTWNVGTVTSVTGTAPIVSSGGTTPAISIPQATALADGYLSSTDWTTFNNKLSQAYQTVQDEGTPLTQRSTIDFVGAAVTVTDDAINSKTVVTITGGGGSGPVGIADSLGQYTYYPDYTTAMAAAVAGQTVEQFADIVEPNNVTITITPGVNINMNGHTYTSTYSVAGIVLFSTTGSLSTNRMQFINGTIIIDSGAVGHTGIGGGGSGDVDCTGLFIRVISSGGLGSAWTSRGIVRNLRGESINSACASLVRATAINCTFNATGTGFGVIAGTNTLGNTGFIYDSRVSSADVNWQGGMINCECGSATMTAGTIQGGAVSTLSADTEHTAGQHSSCAIKAVRIGSTSTLRAASTSNIVLSNCDITGTITISDDTVTNRVEIYNCYITSSSSITNCIAKAAGVNPTVTAKYANNVFRLATTPVDPAVLQGIVNTEDNQGNILV